MPCPDDDKPSKLGKFWLDKLKDERKAEIAVRATIAVLKGLVLLFIPLMKGTFAGYVQACCGILLVNILYGGNAIIKDEGMITLFGKKLLVEEMIICGIEAGIIAYYLLH